MTKYVFGKIKNCLEKENLVIDWISFYEEEKPRLYGPNYIYKNFRFTEIIEWIPGKGFILKIHKILPNRQELVEEVLIERRYIKSIQLITKTGEYYRTRSKNLY